MTSSNHLTVILNSKPMRGLWLQINLLSMIGLEDLTSSQSMTGQKHLANSWSMIGQQLRASLWSTTGVKDQKDSKSKMGQVHQASLWLMIDQWVPKLLTSLAKAGLLGPKTLQLPLVIKQQTRKIFIVNRCNNWQEWIQKPLWTSNSLNQPM